MEPEDEDPQPEGVIDVSILLDYWRMAELTGRDLADPDVRWPEDLLEAHDRMSDAVTQFEARELASKFRIRRKQLARYAFQWRGLLIRPAASQRELVAEGMLCITVWAPMPRTMQTERPPSSSSAEQKRPESPSTPWN